MPRNSLGSILLPILSSIVLVGGSTPAAAVETVFPTGHFPLDVENVQAALDHGGVVVLKSKNVEGVPTAFNFGPAEAGLGGTTSITRNVVISGETGHFARTTIQGGSVPFTSRAQVHLTLLKVRFEAPLEAALVLNASSGALIVGNEVTGVVGAPFFDMTRGSGMEFVGNGTSGAFSGHILVIGNVIRDLEATFGDGLRFESVAAQVTIAFNTIEGVDTNGIFMAEPGGDVTILDNVITPGPGSDILSSLGNGLQLLGTAGGSYRVEGNKITCETPLADGLLMAGGFNWLTFEPGPPIVGAVIRRNDISMSDSCCGAISLFDDVSSSTISHNKLRGGASWGFGLIATGAVAAEAVGNKFFGNDISQLTASLAHVLFFSHAQDNLFRGPSGTVLDLGQNNVFEP